MRLSDDNKAAIVNALRYGAGIQELADRYGCDRKTIQRIKGQGIPMVRDVVSTPMDLDTVTTDPAKAMHGVLETLDPTKILSTVNGNLSRIQTLMEGIAKDERFLVEDRAKCAKVAVDADSKQLALAAMLGGGSALAQAGETPELDAIAEIVEGKG